MDISIDVGKHKLNFRVSAIIRKNNQVLVHHEINSKHVTLPGGRVQDGETTIEALQREIMEEIGYETEVIKPIAFTENFFNANNKDYHELLVTYELKFKDDKIYDKKEIKPIEPYKIGKLQFLWYDIEDLEKDFLPKKLIKVIQEDVEFQHIIDDNR